MFFLWEIYDNKGLIREKLGSEFVTVWSSSVGSRKISTYNPDDWNKKVENAEAIRDTPTSAKSINHST